MRSSRGWNGGNVQRLPPRLRRRSCRFPRIGRVGTYPNLDWIAPSLDAAGLITNDPVFQRVQGLEALVLDGLL